MHLQDKWIHARVRKVHIIIINKLIAKRWLSVEYLKEQICTELNAASIFDTAISQHTMISVKDFSMKGGQAMSIFSRNDKTLFLEK